MSSRFANTIDQRTWSGHQGCSLIAPPFVGARLPTLTPNFGAFAHRARNPPRSSLLGFETRLESGAIRPRPRAHLP